MPPVGSPDVMRERAFVGHFVMQTLQRSHLSKEKSKIGLRDFIILVNR